MTRRLSVLVMVVGAMLLACSGIGLAQSTMLNSSQAVEDFAAGEILVKVKDRTSETKKREVHGKKGGRAKETIR